MIEPAADELARQWVQQLKQEQKNRLRSDLIVWGGMLLVVLVIVLLAR